MKKLIYLTTFILTLVLFTNCNKGTILKIEFNDIAGLDEKSPVQINGFKVGSIKDIKVQPTSKILVEIELNENIPISQDAKFIVISLDILGSKGIAIENGNSKSTIDYNQIQQGQKEKSLVNDSTVKSIINNIVTKLNPETKLDSLDKDIKKLNKNIEQLREKK